MSYNRGIDREEFGEFFGQERRPIDEDDRDRDRERRRYEGRNRERGRYFEDRDRGNSGPRGMEGDYGRSGWGGYGSEGDWEGAYGREGGFGRGSSWGRGGDYGRGADWGPMERGRQGGWGDFYGGYGRREEGFTRGQDYRNRESDWGNWGGRQNWEDYGWGQNWPESRFREGYDWEGQRRGGYGNDTGFGRGGYGPEQRSGRSGQFSGRGPKGYQRSDDRIREDINDRLTDHPDIDAGDAEVHVEGGEVVLRGTVDSRYTKRLAEDIADSVQGVKDVRNELKVRQGTPRQEQQRAA